MAEVYPPAYPEHHAPEEAELILMVARAMCGAQVPCPYHRTNAAIAIGALTAADVEGLLHLRATRRHQENGGVMHKGRRIVNPEPYVESNWGIKSDGD